MLSVAKANWLCRTRLQRPSLVVLCALLFSCTAKHESTGNELVGSVSQSQVFASQPKFSQAYQAYQPSAQQLANVQKLQGKRLLVLFGAWCHDSQRELPRLLKLLDESKVQLADLQLEAVSIQKKSVNGLHSLHKLVYTPTIILLDGERELGRVVERPRQDLASDLASFLD